MKKLAIDPRDPNNWDKPLWVIWGPDCFPRITCVKITRHPTEGPTIWGYSIYRRKPGFRTMGIGLGEWMYQNDKALFFDLQDWAMLHIRELTRPKELE